MESFVWTETTGTTRLGPLPGVMETPSTWLSVAHAISAGGLVVAGVALDSQDRQVPFRWTRAGGMEAIGETGWAEKVNADGTVVFGTYNKGLFRWTRDLGTVAIVAPLPGHTIVRSVAVSDAGDAVIAYSGTTALTSVSLVEWTERSGMRAIENLPGHSLCKPAHASFSRAHGFVVTGSCVHDRSQRFTSFIWTGQDSLEEFGAIGTIAGYEHYEPDAITADGAIAVGYAVPTSLDEQRYAVYRWTEEDGFHIIEPPQGFTGVRLAVREPLSEDGSTVVGAIGDSPIRGFRWSAATGLTVLSPLDGHDTAHATAVSRDGSIVAGTSSVGGTMGLTAVYWRADGVAHRIADELEAGGIGLAERVLEEVWSVLTPLGFLGLSAVDDDGTQLSWRATLR